MIASFAEMVRYVTILLTLGVAYATECAVRLINEADNLASLLVDGRTVDTLAPHVIGSYSRVDCPVNIATVVYGTWIGNAFLSASAPASARYTVLLAVSGQEGTASAALFSDADSVDIGKFTQVTSSDSLMDKCLLRILNVSDTSQTVRSTLPPPA